MLKVSELRCEYRSNPLGIDAERPRFSWKLHSELRGVLQRAYQICVDRGGETLWDTGRVESDSSIHNAYEGPALESLTRYGVKVRVWDNKGRESAWMEGSFETGFLSRCPWRGKWITCDLPKNPPDRIPPWILRRSFTVEKPVESARAYATALGVYQLYLGGKAVDDSRMNPGWTSYNKWMQYQVYDVTSLLRAGENTLEALVGEGWYSGDLCFSHVRNTYGKDNALLLELHIRYSDGSEEIIASDEAFRASTGPVLLSELYHGEVYDARLEGEQHRNWRPVRILEHPREHLTASIAPPVRPIQEIPPVALITTPRGEAVLDMGQNMVGYLRFRVRGKAGQRVILKHCEVLDSDGNFYFDNIRDAKQEIVYILKGGETEVFEPHFTFQGFRYVKVVEHPGTVCPEDFTGVVIHSDMEPVGTFECSHPLLNQLQHNIVWGQKGNFVDVPTDCPQRDERLGWTADAQVFLSTACLNMDGALFFSKWLRDLREDQFENGAVPFVVPNVLPENWGPLKATGYEHASATWGDAATICPWMLYLRYGDRRFLEESYESMKAWVDYVIGESDDKGICRGGAQLGDWLALDAYEGSYHGATPTELVATAYSAYSADLTAKTARILGYDEAAAELEILAEKIAEAFRDEFLPGGKLTCDTQTGYILPLMFDLVEGELRQACIEGLVDHLERHDRHLTTGFVGTPYLCHVLSENGRADLAWELVLHEDFPSWLYQVKKGATTVWEHWDGIKEDGSFWSADMNSFNHYAYGSVGDWLYRVAAGLNTSPEGPGYKRIVLHPEVTERLDSARASFLSVHGRVTCGWRRSHGGLELEVEIPPNTTAVLYLPAKSRAMAEGGQPLERCEGVQILSGSPSTVLELGSGRYSFTC